MRLWWLLSLIPASIAVKCLDCVGKDCMGSFCEGDYCVLSHYAPRWGTIEWGKPRVVKGCMSGTMLRSDIRPHCETADEDGRDKFTCFCQRDHCNSGSALNRLEVEPIKLVTCVCNGRHCDDSTCEGELCSYVVNHKTKEVEQGCVNASVPLVERRSAGACMIPPITGAMHHTVAKDAADLLVTESCVCGTSYCNAKKPKINVKEKMKCQAFVNAAIIGTKMSSKNVTCTGEFCFKAKIQSKLGNLEEYHSIGCASFIDDASLAEELDPTGCARFESEQLDVESCFLTNDRSAIGRARANQEVPEPRRRPGKGRKPKMEIEYSDEEEEEEEAPRKSKGKSKAAKEREEEREEEEEEEEREEEKEEKVKAPVETTTLKFIFERPTEAPIPDDSNTTMISVFIIIMLGIIVSGIVFKLELHKKLFRANYDTVAGG